MLGPKHAVKFSEGTWHQIKIRERRSPSRGTIQKCALHERSPCATKFGERSHEETLHQERCARKAARDLAQNIYKLKNSVLTADGEVHTYVTVQLLEEQRAVLSFGHLCKNHGNSFKWVSGQEPRLTQNGKSISARQTILYLFSFQGYPRLLESVRLLHRCHKNRWDQRHS